VVKKKRKEREREGYLRVSGSIIIIIIPTIVEKSRNGFIFF
tara:strand:+ start:3102 stop:3224 length:123 start_codon:yes stop_codon:yes gene_type:complete